jgi:hypothetical protein
MSISPFRASGRRDSDSGSWVKMEDFNDSVDRAETRSIKTKDTVQERGQASYETLAQQSTSSTFNNTNRDTTEARNEHRHGHTTHKVYKRRWFGLVQLVLLNIVVSWDVRAPFLPILFQERLIGFLEINHNVAHMKE